MPTDAQLDTGSATGISRPQLRPSTASVSVIMPIYNARPFLSQTVPALLTAVGRLADVEVLFVDNGSTDGSVEYLSTLQERGVHVLRREHATIAAVRNHGWRHASGEYLAFLDADCLISEDYFLNAIETLQRTGAIATGCEVSAPTRPHWIEETWHELHYVGRDRYVHYLNSANFFISRVAFEEVGGFREELLTGEDAEIGQRILRAGRSIYECTRVAAIHLGNPKSVGQFFRRTVWHALGMFSTVNLRSVDKPTAMMLSHLLASMLGLVLPLSAAFPLWQSLALSIALQLIVPAITVIFRCYQVGRARRLISGVALYWLYYWARLYALLLILSKQSSRYRK